MVQPGTKHSTRGFTSVVSSLHTLCRLGKAFPDQYHKLSKREFQNPQNGNCGNNWNARAYWSGDFLDSSTTFTEEEIPFTGWYWSACFISDAIRISWPSEQYVRIDDLRGQRILCPFHFKVRKSQKIQLWSQLFLRCLSLRQSRSCCGSIPPHQTLGEHVEHYLLFSM